MQTEISYQKERQMNLLSAYAGNNELPFGHELASP